VTYNSREFIGAALDSYLAQQVDGGIELIVVDNGSTDGTPTMVESRYPMVRLLRESNRGFGAGNNRGARASSSPLLVFVNPDTIGEPGCLQELVAALAFPRTVVTAQVVLASDPTRINTAGNHLHFTGSSFVRDFQRQRLGPGHPVAVAGISGAAFAMRRKDFLDVGGFDEEFFLYLEDTELSWRLHRLGFDILLAPAAVVQHSYHFQLPPAKLGHVETGRILLLRKHYTKWMWWSYAPSLLIVEILSWGRASLLGAAGLRAAWRGLRRGWRRGILQPTLPPLRLEKFAGRTMPLKELFPSIPMRVVTTCANAVFLLNTWTWWLRRPK
jgi:GT2 family glycosyltransferase